MKRRIVFLLLLSLILSLLLPITAFSAQGPAVYIRKHVSILYDNSGSMKMRLTEGPNLRWCYASYAAQMFAGLLNDTDTLDITFMEGTPLDDLEMSKPRQDILNTIFDRTGESNADTPFSKVYDALKDLEGEGLKKGQGTNAPGEQYWLVLTTDGQFRDDNQQNLSDEDVVGKLSAIMADFPDLHVVYFGIGTKAATDSIPDDKDNAAKDFRESSANVEASLIKQLHSYNNFTAVYAETQEQIISTMRSLSNQISGRYTVPNQAEVSGNEVRLYLDAEGSPIRNIALMAQETNARLLSATAEDGTQLAVSRDGQIRFPYNSAYENMPEGTLGGYVALITDPSGKKIPNGTVTLTFSEPIPQEDLVLMYEPAIYLHLEVERNNGDGQWKPLTESDKLLEGDQIRIKYAICEDGTGRVLDPRELFGETLFQCLFNGQEFSEDQVLTVSQGDITLEIRASMMDGGYTINVIRNYHVSQPGLEDYTVKCTGPIELRRKDVAENTEKYIEFSVLFRDQPAPEDFTSKLSIRVESDPGRLDGTTDKPASHSLRFTPKDEDCVAGEYTVSLYYEKTVLATERITVLPNETTYSAVAGGSISIMSNCVADNTDSVSFTVTAHRDQGDGPITPEESDLFTVKAGNGTELKGHTAWSEGGQLLFTMQDPSAVPGTYPVSLWLEDKKLAETSITVIHYDASYTVQVTVSNPNTVDRFHLRENTSSVTFLVLEDGVPCSSAQLEAMLDRELLISHALNSPYAVMDIRVATVDGKPVIVCTPVSATQSSILLFFQKMIIACGGGNLHAGDLPITLTVDMPKGAEAQGTLTLIGNPTPYLIVLLIILAVLALLFLFFFMNAKTKRLYKGVLWSFTLNSVDDSPYTASRSTAPRSIGWGWKAVLFKPKKEKHTIEGLLFQADLQRTEHNMRIAGPKTRRSLFGWKRQHPNVVIEAKKAPYCYSSKIGKTAKLFLSAIRNGNRPITLVLGEEGLPVKIESEFFADSNRIGPDPNRADAGNRQDSETCTHNIQLGSYMIYYKQETESLAPSYTVCVYEAYAKESPGKKLKIKQGTPKHKSKRIAKKSKFR